MGGARSQHGADQRRARRASTLVRLRDLLGSASGASFGVAVALALMGSTPFATEWLTRLGMTSAAFVGAVGAVFLTLALARGVHHTLRLLLAGVVVGVVLGALGSLIAMLQPEVMLAMQAFMLGSTSFVGWSACALMAAAWALCMLTAALLSHVLEAHGLRAQLGGVEVLHGIDLGLRRGGWTSVVGPNGAGKSTLLKALAQLLPCQGEVRLLGADVAGLGGRARARSLAWLGQNEASGDDLTVWDVAMLGRLPHQAWLAPPSAADHQAVELALRSTQAWDWRERALGQLSGGERQRVLLARALAVGADVMLMDEPLANLDPPHQAHWLAIVRALIARGKTVVSVLHEVSMALHADDIVIMEGGRVSHHGRSADPSTHAALCAVFEHCFQIQPLDGQWVVLPRAMS